MRQPRMPLLMESRDQLDSYLARFEMQEKVNKWREEQWFMCLSNLLTGEALEVLHALSPDQCTYGHLKASLLKRFKFTEEGFRERFRSSVPRSGQDFETFINQLMKLMDRWLESASIKDGDFAQLKELVLREQVYNSCHADLVTLLKERNAKTTADLKSLAETYAKAHPSKPLAREDNVINAGIRREEPTDRSTGPAQSANAARNEPTPRFRKTLRARVNADSLDQSLYRQDWHNNNSNNTISTIKDGITEAFVHQIDFLEETGGRTETEAEVITITNEKTTDDPLMAGSSQDRIIAILLSECRQHLPCSPTRSQPDHCHFSQQRCHIDSPFFTGNAFVFVLPNSIADVVIGNISGVDDTPLRSYIKNNKSDPEAGSRTSPNTANVSTRATSRAEIRRSTSQTDSSSGNQITNIDGPTNKDTLFSLGPFQDMDVQSFRTEQLNYPSLKALRDKAFKSHTRLLKNDLLYRKAKKTGYEDQLVVPTNLREGIMRLCHETSLAGQLGITATKKKIFRRFTWLNITMDVKNYIGSCHQCQIHAPRLPKLPIEEMEAISKPFEKVAIDIVGP
ncbi:reverse transcriptase [Plakobranchus ocellatus]|uniref:Reverse transcriptase n=1 Tax=Plakobranchus ocellatus TaxID=259542 RepID=A0AAV4D9D9_9GAST|nr:reverse transcriptase [Plakobranchus ocellatus]